MAQTVTTALLTRRDPNLEGRWPSAQSSWAEQIEAAHADVRRDLRLRGYAWERFAGVSAGAGPPEDYAGTNTELNDLIEAKALELVYRACARSEEGRWSHLAAHWDGVYERLLDAYAGSGPPGAFTTHDADGSGSVEPEEQGDAGRVLRL